MFGKFVDGRNLLLYFKTGALSPNLQTFKEPNNRFQKESIPPAYLAWRTGTSNRVVLPRNMIVLLKSK